MSRRDGSDALRRHHCDNLALSIVKVCHQVRCAGETIGHVEAIEWIVDGGRMGQGEVELHALS